MNEWLIIGLLVGGVLCWTVGGTGFKWVRRFLWPIACAIVALVGGVGWLSAILLGIALIAVNVLPYGDRTPWPVKGLVFCLLPVPALIVSVWPTALFIPIAGGLLLGLMWMSRKWNAIAHKLWEASAGLGQAGAVVVAILALVSQIR